MQKITLRKSAMFALYTRVIRLVVTKTANWKFSFHNNLFAWRSILEWFLQWITTSVEHFEGLVKFSVFLRGVNRWSFLVVIVVMVASFELKALYFVGKTNPYPEKTSITIILLGSLVQIFFYAAPFGPVLTLQW